MKELLTSLDVVNQSFKKSIRGYDAAEVDEFLDNVSESLQVYAQKTKDMERELAAKEASLNEYEKMKTVLHEALITAQKSADDKVSNAQIQADKIVTDAHKKGDDICREAAAEAEKLRDGIFQIRKIRTLYEQEFRGMLAKFDTLLNQCGKKSALDGAVDSALEGMEEEQPAAEQPQPETAKPQDAPAAPAADKKDLAAAYNMLGVDPKEILDQKQDADKENA